MNRYTSPVHPLFIHVPCSSKKLIIKKYGSLRALVLDEWLPDKPDDDFRSMLMELRCERLGVTS